MLIVFHIYFMGNNEQLRITVYARGACLRGRLWEPSLTGYRFMFLSCFYYKNCFNQEY